MLEALFEPPYEDWSYYYRPQRSPHQGLDARGHTLQQMRVNILVGANVRGFLERLPGTTLSSEIVALFPSLTET